MDTQNQSPEQTELAILKNRARTMGITFSNNIGVDALRAKINAQLESGDNEDAEDEGDQDENPEDNEDAEEVVTAANTPEPEPNPLETAPQKQKNKKLTLRQKIIAEQTKLVRLRITNLDPKKKDLQGEIFTVANEYMGTIRKFVPFGEVTDNGYHVPYAIYKMMNARRFLHISTTKDRKTNTPKVRTQWAKEFALEILPPLTEAELAKLANAQAAAGSLED